MAESDSPQPSPADVAPTPDNVCVCFHVPLVKLLTFLRRERPVVASQMSQCFGAGTGCGWCIPFLEKLHEDWKANPNGEPALGLSTADYLARRREYLKRINAQRMRDSEGDLAAAPDLIEPE